MLQPRYSTVPACRRSRRPDQIISSLPSIFTSVLIQCRADKYRRRLPPG
jgi:hypothetical protein